MVARPKHPPFHVPSPQRIERPIHPRGNLLRAVSPYDSRLAVSSLLRWVHDHHRQAGPAGLMARPLAAWVDGAWPTAAKGGALGAGWVWPGLGSVPAVALVVFQDRSAVAFKGDRADAATALYSPVLCAFKLPPVYTCPIAFHGGRVLGRPLDGPRVAIGAGHPAVDRAAAALEQSVRAWIAGPVGPRWRWDVVYGPDTGVDAEGYWQIPLWMPHVGCTSRALDEFRLVGVRVLQTAWDAAPYLHGHGLRLSLCSPWRGWGGQMHTLYVDVEPEKVFGASGFAYTIEETVAALLRVRPEGVPEAHLLHGRCVRLLEAPMRGEKEPRAVLAPFPLWTWEPEVSAHRRLVSASTPVHWPARWTGAGLFER